MQLPQRKATRLKGYDYSSPGVYFITICTQNRKCMLSDLVVGEGLAPPETRLSEIGRIAEEQILALEERFPSVSIDRYVVMPNHIHILLLLREQAGGASPSPTVPQVIGTFKSITTRLNRAYGAEGLVFQRSFHDHVVRGEADYREIWDYIDSNPARWQEDRFYTD
ncbi:MAG TPA: hypothetical protein DCM61_04740 [Clostridiales bacterium]|nr:hypothetical protein [Clostridiales bacterium]